ncbi:MAG: hypothetical protein SGI73_05360 [Chloroflexota bacterium]|nr:hypothetical protein [Chloroflexota bacterium]
MIGTQLSPPDFAERFAPTLCDETLCLLNIVPGKTTWTAAQQHLASQPGGEIGARHIIIQATSGGEIGFYPSMDTEFVGRIYGSYAPVRSIAIGWIIQAIGVPCGVSYYWRTRTNLLTLRYPLMVVNLQLHDDQFTPYSLIDSIQLNDPAFDLRTQPDPCVDNISNGVNNSNWRGFFGVVRYAGVS